MRTKLLGFAGGVLAMLTSAALLAETPQAPRGNDFPTLGRVEYVLGCMTRYGGEHYNNLYACVCSVDKLAEKIQYDQFVANQTLQVMINTPGEKGGPFRDATGGRKAVRAFEKFVAETEASCGLKKKD